VGAESFAEKSIAEKAFGFDIRAAGLLPVKIVIDNKSAQGIEVISGQTFLIDGANRYWKILTNREAVERVKKATDSGGIISGTGKGVAWRTAASSLMDLAIGIVSRRDLASSVVKGNVLSGAGGAVFDGASKTGDDKQQEIKIAEAIREKGVEGKIMPAESLASGFIFFSGEVSSVSELRLQIKSRDSGRIQTLNLKLN
jgi:hypothetical protein